MARMIFVNLPVADVERSAAFYEGLGFTRDARFSQTGQAAAMVWSDTISVMLLSHGFFQGFTPRRIADASEVSEVLLCLSMDSRAEVDAFAERAAAHGGTVDVHPPQDHGFMYGRSIADPDGHIFEPAHMDLAAMPAAAEGAAHEPA